MERASGARLIVAMLVIGAFSTTVLGDDDAGSGVDAGDTTSNALYLNATNATYQGNLSSSDTDDYYAINMSQNTGIAADLTFDTSQNDYDLWLLDSSGSTIDNSLSWSDNESVTSNGSNVGGTTVFIRVQAYSGSGGYSLDIRIFGTGNLPGSVQDDANSSMDAGSSAGSSILLNSTNQTFSGWISDTWDSEDWYNITVPSGHGIYAMMDFPNGTAYNSQLWLVDDTGNQGIAYASTSPWEVTSNGTSVDGLHVYIRVYTYSDEGDYNITLQFFSTAGQPGSVQDDAGSGTDAGDTISTALQISVPTSGGTYYGWIDDTWDSTDFYAVDVPTNWTTWASLSWNGTSTNPDLDLYLYSSSGDILAQSWYDNPELVTGNGSSVSGTTVFYRVDSYSGATALNYTLEIDFGNLSNTPAFNQNDAGSGGDAGNDLSTALNLSSSNSTYYGWISDTADTQDVYAVHVPTGYAIDVELFWNISSNNFDLYLYDNLQNIIDSSYNSNPESVQSGSTNVSNTTVYIVVESFAGWWSSGGEGNYSLNISLINQSSVPSLNQNDANSGGDAGDEFSNSTPINATTGYSYWEGFADENDDQYDYYSVYVPLDHGIYVELSPGYSNAEWFTLTLFDSSQNEIDYSYYYDPQFVSDNGTGTNLGGSDATLEVWAYQGEGIYNLSIWIFSLDADGDGYFDEVELDCGSDPYDNMSTPTDTDADGTCDYLDEDIDGDGVGNSEDSFPEDANETSDNDNDGTGDNSDTDDDNDGWSDYDEGICDSDPLDYSSTPDDTDQDGICDNSDDDIDGDGYLNEEDSFDFDSSEWNDTDGDGMGDNSDTDDDNDGHYDDVEENCLSDPLDYYSTPEDTDEDGVCDELDDDVDGDGTTNDLDSSPFDPNEDTDTDGDNIGDNADPDDDNDGYLDEVDEFPLDVNEWSDNDEDGTGDNADPDDDNDGWDDLDEIQCNTNQFSELFVPSDSDGDHICDLVDTDDDNDGYEDSNDAFQFDPNEWSDIDSDDIGDNADLDDDGDGWSDLDEFSICGTDPVDFNSIPEDFDRDGICDPLDDDDDNDLVLDTEDKFPFDPSEYKDTDGDGTGDGKDSDDDGDGWGDAAEVICKTSSLDSSEVPDDFDNDSTCDFIDPDDDNDGVVDELDAFPYDGDEWMDRNSDGKGDNGFPLTAMDHMKLNPEITVLGIGIISSLFAGSIAFAFGRRTEKREFEEEGEQFDFDFADDW